VPYLAWCYDAPTFSEEYKNLTYQTTHCFLFDSADWIHYKYAGVENAYYLPLAADIDYYDSIKCSTKDKEKYNSEISFVGRLYDTVLPNAMGYLSDYDKAYLAAIMDNQANVRGYGLVAEIIKELDNDSLNNKEFNWIINHNKYDTELNPNITTEKLHMGMLGRLIYHQITNKERLLILTLLSNHHEVKLYSDKTSNLLGNLKFCGPVDYNTQMPKVFKCSKINLNVTMRDIVNGIPLRCIDIMACGGCLLTNYQKDFDEHFKDGENILLYNEPYEALDKADYYLSHDTKLEKIAQSGYETIKKYYTYPVKIREMLEKAGLNDLIKTCGRGII
jgi:spore maturation protein CgeB